MSNNTDPYVGFDPTQTQGQGCCDEKVYDFQTGVWVAKKQPPTCEELLEKALAEEQKAKEQKALAEEQKALAEEQKALAEEQKALAEEQKAQAISEKDQALTKLADCEKKQPDCPLEPVYSIGDKHLFDAYKCGEGMTSIGGETIGGTGAGLPEDDPEISGED